MTDDIPSFAELGLHPDLCKVLEMREWTKPTPIQQHAIPLALQGRDIIGLAVTGSGKTGAFCLPIIHKLIDTQPPPYSVAVIAPTRELSVQIAEQFRVFGIAFQLKVATLVGGLSSMDQTKELARQPHVVVATPGRLVDHLQNTKGFDLKSLQFLVLDEADRLLSMDFESDLLTIIKESNTDRQTFLFSATMTSKLSKLEKVSLNRPVKIEMNEKTKTAENLTQYIVVLPSDEKFQYLGVLLKRLNAYRIIVFCNTCRVAMILTGFLRRFQFECVALTGHMDQKTRLGALNRFKSGRHNILITTEVASRGMDIPSVNYVVNFDVPNSHKDYIHRVGRTARAGSIGSAFTLVTKLDVQLYKSIEDRLYGDRRELWPQVYKEIEPDDYNQPIYKEAKIAAEKEYEDNNRRRRKRKA